MAGWTKAQFDAAYKFWIERRMPGGGPPPAEGRPGVVIHYHKLHQRPWLAAMWAKLQPILIIDSTDLVCIVGAGFGWGVEAVIAETNATVIGIDISDYIAAEAASTEEVELRAEVVAGGLDPDTGKGLEVMNFIFDGEVRSTVIVLQSDAASGPQRNAIRQALGGNPTVMVAEDVIDDTFTDADIISMRNSMNGFGGTQRLIFIYKQRTGIRSLQDVFDLLNAPPNPNPSEVISTDGTVYLT